LPGRGHGRALDRRAGLAVGRAALSAAHIADRESACARAHRTDRAVPRRVATRPHVTPPGSHGQHLRHRGAHRCRVRRHTRLRAYLRRAGLPYAVGISSTVSIFRGRPTLIAPATRNRGRLRTRSTLRPGVTPIGVRAVAAAWPARQWRTLRCRNAPGAPLARPRRRHPRHTRPRVAPAVGARSVAPGRTASEPNAADESTISCICLGRRPSDKWSISRISDGRSNSSTKNSKTGSASITSRAGRCPVGSGMWP
jgi:hypothetical protein